MIAEIQNDTFGDEIKRPMMSIYGVLSYIEMVGWKHDDMCRGIQLFDDGMVEFVIKPDYIIIKFTTRGNWNMSKGFQHCVTHRIEDDNPTRVRRVTKFVRNNKIKHF